MISLTGTRRRSMALLGVTALAAAVVISAPAQAGTTPPWNVIDGLQHAVSANGLSVNDPYGSSDELGPRQGDSYKLLSIHDTGLSVLGLSKINKGVDFTNVTFDTAVDGDDDVWAYVSFGIESFTTGQTAVEFMEKQSPAGCDYSQSDAYLIANCHPWELRQAGDFLLVADYQGNGGDLALWIRTWLPGNGPGGLVLGPKEAIDDSIGDGVALKKADGSGFVEMAVNLTDAVFGEAAQCTTIGNIIPSTLTGNSDNADYKDTVLAGFAERAKISTCGTVEVIKLLNPSDAPVPGADDDPFAWTLSRDGGEALRYDVDGDDTQHGQTSLSGGLGAHQDSSGILPFLIAGDDYELAEVINPPADDAFELEKIMCQVGDGTPVDATDATFSVVAGATTTCYITNKETAGTLVVNKVVVNDNGGMKTAGDFTFDVSGPDDFADAEFTEDESDALMGSWSQYVPRGTYAVTEDDPSLMGYDESYAYGESNSCAAVEVPAGGTATCTITNDDKAATLIVQKVVDNTAGGTSTASDFQFDVDGPDVASSSDDNVFVEDEGDELAGEVTLIGLSAGSYTVEEDAVTGYTETYGGDCAADGTLSLALGETKTCVVTNTAQKATPSLATVQSWVLHDTVTLTNLRTGAPDAGAADEIVFALYGNDMCTGDPIGTEQATLSGGSASTSTGVTVTESGTYAWKVTYKGDAYNDGAVTACSAESTDEVTQILAKDAKDGGRDDFAE